MKTKFLLSIVLLFPFWNNSFAQVGVGTPNPEGALDVTSSTNGVLVPRIALSANNTVSPVVNPNGGAVVNGTLIWNTATVAGVNGVSPGFYYWNSPIWIPLGGSTTGTKWDLLGNVVGAVGTNFIGSTDNNPVSFRTNNIEKLRLSSNSQLLGIPLPAAAAGVVGSGLAPFYSFSGNQGSGMYSPGSNILGFSTNFGERLRLDSTGFLGIGTNFATTAPEAILDIRSTTKGILIPRVALTSITTMAPVLTARNSELVFNTATAGTAPNDVTPGFYYWTTTPAQWNKVGASVDVKSGTASATGTLVEPTITIPNIFTNAGSNTNAVSIPSNTTDTRTINVTGFVGNTTGVKCNVKFNHAFLSEADIYLQSPTGQIIELMTDIASGFGTTNDILFDDAAATNVTAAGGASIVGTYRPEGTLTVDVITPNITTMAGFNGVSPNGLWTLHMRDDTVADNFDFNSFSLDFSTTATPLQYRLVGETSLTYKTGTNLIVNSMYSANPNDDGGFVTALTRTAASAGAIGTLVSSLPSTVISYASDSPKQGAGNYWATTYNQAVPSGLVNGTTYFFQLWAKGNIPTPFSSNEIFSLIPMIIPQ